MPNLKLDKRGKLKLSERAIEQQIIDALEAHGWRVLRTNRFTSGNAVVVQGSTELGIPDLQARRLGGKYIGGYTAWNIAWIEVKRPGQDLNANQCKWWSEHPDEDRRIACRLEDIEDLLK